jgi:aryl carrier-like protein
LTAERFVPDPFGPSPGGRLYRTGDLVRYRDRGEIEFLGRIDNQVKVRGYRIELGEIEAVLGRLPGVKEAVVVVREEEGEKRLVAYVVGGEGGAPSAVELRGYLKGKLPEYMVPSGFVMVERLPLSPNGKVDQRALAKWEGGVSEPEQEFEEPRTRGEEELCRIWGEVLGVEGVGIRDNFFELGGDSILSIQIVSRAREAGLRLTLKQLFQHQTVAELAGVAGTSAEVEAEQGLVAGEAALTPIQRWFFEQELAEGHHYNQVVLLEVRQGLAPEVLGQAVSHLQEHHDALRTRFERVGEGWRQEVVGEAAVPFVRVELGGIGEEERGRAIEGRAEEAQRSLDLSEGPVWRVVLFEVGGAPYRLLVVIHHLVVDGVSWRVLLEDLQTSCEQLGRGEGVRLPRKTTSFQRWAEKLGEYARS